jgi:hypothetical protein
MKKKVPEDVGAGVAVGKTVGWAVDPIVGNLVGNAVGLSPKSGSILQEELEFQLYVIIVIFWIPHTNNIVIN